MATLRPKYGQEDILGKYMKRAFEAGFLTQGEYDSFIAAGGIPDTMPLVLWNRVLQDANANAIPGFFTWRMIALQFDPVLLADSEPNLTEAYITKMNS